MISHLLTLLLLTSLTQTHASDDTAELEPNRPDPIHTNTLQSSESGGGKGGSGSSDDSEERKTLSQQVADGKYGLIQRELFANGGLSAPGVISYRGNSEVPKDTEENLGGLQREEIWLAEDHLLVLRGGKFEPDDGTFPLSAVVPPIDDYRAPLRQVKIPSKPKIPPPFPVQLQDDGPIQILEAANPGDNRDGSSSQAGAHGGYPTDPLTGGVKKHNAKGSSASPHSTPENSRGGAVRGKIPPLGPAGPIDEDDPSIYYPPPYSFFYPKDNSSAVPPGPLVPGIVLPPPPNFFGRLNPPSSTIRPPQKPTTYRPTISTTTPTPTTRVTAPSTTTTPRPPQQSTTPKPYLPPIHNIIVTSTPLPPLISQAPKPVYYEFFETNKIQPPQRVHQQIQQVPQVQEAPQIQQVPQVQEAPQIQQVEQVPQAPIRNYISSTAVPLRAFFKSQQRPAQIYYYEEDPSINEVNTPKTQPPRIFIATVARPPPKPQINLNNFEHHIQQLRNQIRFQQQRQQRYQQNKRYRQPRPVYQYSFGYDERRPTPQPPRYNVQIQQNYDYRRPQELPQIITPSPIEQYRPITPSPIDPYRTIPQIVTPSPINNQEYQQITPNPIEYRRPELVTQNPYNQGNYYTKDDGYYDDITKKYFPTVYGQKLTTPLPPLLQNDLNVNYRRPLPPHNPQAEFFNENPRAPTAEGGPGTFISYRLPGDGAHFYFLTPQLAQQQQRQRSDNENGYYYPAPQQRLRRTS